MEITVARAAPATPSAGRPSHPNIRRGSRTTFSRALETIVIMEYLVAPTALRDASNVIRVAISGRPSTLTAR